MGINILSPIFLFEIASANFHGYYNPFLIKNRTIHQTFSVHNYLQVLYFAIAIVITTTIYVVSINTKHLL